MGRTGKSWALELNILGFIHYFPNDPKQVTSSFSPFMVLMAQYYLPRWEMIMCFKCNNDSFWPEKLVPSIPRSDFLIGAVWARCVTRCPATVDSNPLLQSLLSLSHGFAKC